MELELTDIAERRAKALVRSIRQERNDILEVLIKLVITRRDGAPREETEEAFDKACVLIKEWAPIIAKEEEEGVDALDDKGDMTLAELVNMVREHEAGSMMVDGSTVEDPATRSWLVIAAVGKTANALYRWNQIDYDDDSVEQRAKAAYEAYGDFTDNKNFQGNPMPKWEDLPDKIRGAWQAASMELAQLVAGDDEPELEDPAPEES